MGALYGGRLGTMKQDRNTARELTILSSRQDNNLKLKPETRQEKRADPEREKPRVSVVRREGESSDLGSTRPSGLRQRAIGVELEA